MQNAITRLCALASACLLSTSAAATSIEFETRATTNGVNQSDFVSSWFAQTSAVQSTRLTAFDNIAGAGSHRHSRLRIGFDLDELSNIVFQFAPDAGYGGALYINSLLFQQQSTDLWWGFNWQRSHEIFDTTGAELALGFNTIDLYWAEACCNGGQSGRFSLNGGQDWETLSVDNLERVTVPEPGTLVLLATGLLGGSLARRRHP